eukprot:TRINITY_DN775_c0_g1_i5.p1 TRINITY_DN775_c0_g1~~TRINITY_DN775_c0_g1_i5.p1  ORF type:complete len:212 (-),score=53.71 TRINITY_DN775_c0_g1_i5:841-1476(-)
MWHFIDCWLETWVVNMNTASYSCELTPAAAAFLSAADRSDFHGQREAASAALREWMRAHAGRDVYVMGDSYGGLVAAGVALTLQEEQQLKGVILSNPATSFPSTFFARWGATLCRLPGPLFSAFSGVLALLTLDKVVLRNMISVARGDRRWPEDRIAASDAPKLNVWLDAMMGNMEPLDSRTLLFRIQNLLGTGTTLRSHHYMRAPAGLSG